MSKPHHDYTQSSVIAIWHNYKRGGGGISPGHLKANPSMSPFFKGGFKSHDLFKDKLLKHLLPFYRTAMIRSLAKSSRRNAMYLDKNGGI
jgi:hypothetical protein